MSFKRILVAIDDDPIAVRAADIGIELAQSLHAEVALIHAIDPSLTYAPASDMPATELELLAERDGKRLMADFRARLPTGTTALQFIPQGPPGVEIAKAAKEWNADVIVIGSHGRRGITRALVGSVAEAVMRHAHCPVLVVRTGV